MSEWSVPSGATPQDYPRQPKDGIGDFVARFRAFQVEVRDKYNNLLSRAGIHVEPDLVRFTGAVWIEGDATVSGAMASADFDGDLAAGDAGTTGWAMNAARVAIGELFLRPGSVGNESLTSPVEVDDFAHTETGFDPTAGAWATVSSVTLTVPDGFTQALVTAIAYAGITSAGGDIHCRATVAGAGGPADTRSTSAGQWRPVLSMFSHRVTGLTGGGTVAVACQAYVATDVGADAANTATISGTVSWLR